MVLSRNFVCGSGSITDALQASTLFASTRAAPALTVVRVDPLLHSPPPSNLVSPPAHVAIAMPPAHSHLHHHGLLAPGQSPTAFGSRTSSLVIQSPPRWSAGHTDAVSNMPLSRGSSLHVGREGPLMGLLGRPKESTPVTSRRGHSNGWLKDTTGVYLVQLTTASCWWASCSFRRS